MEERIGNAAVKFAAVAKCQTNSLITGRANTADPLRAAVRVAASALVSTLRASPVSAIVDASASRIQRCAPAASSFSERPSGGKV